MKFDRTLTLLVSIFLILAASYSMAISFSTANNSIATKSAITANTTVDIKHLNPGWGPKYGLAPFAPAPLIDFSKAVPDSTPYLNWDNTSSPYYGEVKLNLSAMNASWRYGNGGIPKYSNNTKLSEVNGISASSSTYVPFDHEAWGTVLWNNPNLVAVYAQQQYQPNVQLTSQNHDVALFAPTLEFVNGCPLESVMVYTYTPPIGGTGVGTRTAFWNVWNHSSVYYNGEYHETGNWTQNTQKIVNSDFLNKYVQTDGDGRSWFYTEIGKMPGDSRWQVWLYNFQSRNWEHIYATSWSDWGSNEGWDEWETHFWNNDVGPIPEIKSQGLMLIQSNGVGVYAMSPNAAVMGSVHIPQDYNVNMISNYYEWSVASY